MWLVEKAKPIGLDRAAAGADGFTKRSQWVRICAAKGDLQNEPDLAGSMWLVEKAKPIGLDRGAAGADGFTKRSQWVGICAAGVSLQNGPDLAGSMWRMGDLQNEANSR